MYFISTCTNYDQVQKHYKMGLNVTENYKIRYHISSLKQIFMGRHDYQNVVRLTIPKNDYLHKKGSGHYSYTYEVNMINVEQIYRLDDYEDVKSLIELGVDVNEAISNIVVSNNLDSLKYLLEKGANIIFIDSDIAKFGNLELFELLLENKCRLDKFLPMAAEYGQFELVKFLVKNGVFIDYVDRSSFAFSEYTGLVAASSRGYTEIVNYLIDNGANCNKSHGIYLAAKNGHYDTAKLLIEKGANLDKYGQQCIEDAIKKGHIKIIELLIDSGVEINYEYGIYKAGLLGNTKLVRYLINLENSKKYC
uniref:Putative ankyrin repeat protein n=1 Tax=Moumouvirus sp. 'Monve' TaxID=1128131 RepID=H2EFP4_9VIRU|nr:putative ankyrin repeat protein [Moumouvirus Monve]